MPEWAARAPGVLLVDTDPALRGLLGEWLAPQGYRVVQSNSSDAGCSEDVDLVVLDLPSPRLGHSAALQRVAREHPRAPVIALSSSFFPGIESRGAVARSLGVASVLPKPVTRDALLSAVERILSRSS